MKVESEAAKRAKSRVEVARLVAVMTTDASHFGWLTGTGRCGLNLSAGLRGECVLVVGRTESPANIFLVGTGEVERSATRGVQGEARHSHSPTRREHHPGKENEEALAAQPGSSTRPARVYI